MIVHSCNLYLICNINLGYFSTDANKYISGISEGYLPPPEIARLLHHKGMFDDFEVCQGLFIGITDDIRGCKAR